MSKNVNPDHYKNRSTSPIELIEAYGLADGFCRGNVIKYVARAKEKNGKEDDLKALWYLLYLLGLPIEQIQQFTASFDQTDTPRDHSGQAPMVYLAGPIDAADSKDWADDIGNRLAERNVITFAPQHPYNGPIEKTKLNKIRRANEAVIRECDALVANMSVNAPTAGTPIEIQYTLALGKPVVVISRQKFLYLNGVEYADGLDDAVEKVLACLKNMR